MLTNQLQLYTTSANYKYTINRKKKCLTYFNTFVIVISIKKQKNCDFIVSKGRGKTS